MTKARVLVLGAALLTILVAAAHVDAIGRPSAARCGGHLWRMKTLSDQDRNAVRLTPETTTIHAIVKRRAPAVTPVWRATAFQRQTWEVVAQIVNFRSEEGELRLRLFDDGSYMNAAIPTPSCLLATSRARDAMASAWRSFARTCAIPRYRWQPLGAVAYVRGVGFWSQRHTEHGTAPNGAELHPVTSFRIVAGCA